MRQKLKQGISRLLVLFMSLNFIAPSFGTQAFATDYTEDKELLVHFVWEADTKLPIQAQVTDTDGNLITEDNGVNIFSVAESGNNYGSIDEVSDEASQVGTWARISTADIQSATSTIEFQTASETPVETKVAMVVIDPDGQKIIAKSEQDINETSATLGMLRCSDDAIMFRTYDENSGNL